MPWRSPSETDLGYESRASAEPPVLSPRRRVIPGAFLATAGAMLLLTGVVTLILPRVETVYSDLGVTLPPITRVVLSSAHSINGVAAWVIAIPLSLFTGYVFATLPFGGRALRLVLTLLFAAAILAVALAVFLPLLSLTERLAP